MSKNRLPNLNLTNRDREYLLWDMVKRILNVNVGQMVKHTGKINLIESTTYLSEKESPLNVNQ